MKKLLLTSLFFILFVTSGVYIYLLSNPQTQEAGQDESSNPPSDLEENEIKQPPIDRSDWRLILVNQASPLPDSFTPQLANLTASHKVDARIVESLQQMEHAAKQDNITLLFVSGYRTFERSAYLYQKQVDGYLAKGYGQQNAEKEAAKWVLPPGKSEHHTGLAIDIVTPSYTALDHGFAETSTAKWLASNAYRFGFVLRYPAGKESITQVTFEPWHFRYVGTEHARIMTEKNVTLEEYLGAT